MLLLFWRSAPAFAGATSIVGRPRSALLAARAAQQTVSQRAVVQLASTATHGSSAPLVILSVGRGALIFRHGSAALVAVRARPIHLIATRATELQFALAVDDVSDGGWTNELGSTVNLYASLDEAVASDADYLQSSPSPLTPDEVKVRLGGVSYPLATTDHVVRYRYQKNLSLGDTLDLDVTLYRADGVTVIAARTHSDIDGVTDETLALTEAEAGSIPPSDYSTGLVLGLKVVVS